jgi:hypothetical protein
MEGSDRTLGRPGGLDREVRRPRLKPALPLTALLSVLTLVALGCSTKTAATNPTVLTTPSPAATTPTSPAAVATTPAPSASTAAAVDLSGTWSGTYSGAFSGTFSLTWTQSGSNLSGTIKLSAPPSTLGITGTVQGTAITFGAVGGVAYSGSVSGTNSMSGSYTVPGATAGGSWSATKS